MYVPPLYIGPIFGLSPIIAPVNVYAPAFANATLYETVGAVSDGNVIVDGTLITNRCTSVAAPPFTPSNVIFVTFNVSV